MANKHPADTFERLQKTVREKIANNPIIHDSIRRAKMNHTEKERAYKLIGGDRGVFDKIWHETKQFDTSKRHTEDD